MIPNAVVSPTQKYLFSPIRQEPGAEAKETDVQILFIFQSFYIQDTRQPILFRDVLILNSEYT